MKLNLWNELSHLFALRSLVSRHENPKVLNLGEKMKIYISLTILLFSIAARAEEKWLTVAQTTDCGKQISVKAKEGVPFVMIGNEKLPSKEGKPFSLSSPDANSFENKSYVFRMPGMIENGVPKLDMKEGLNQERCNMKAFRN